MISELRKAVSEAITRLPNEHRLVWVLSEHQGISYKGIGQILGCSSATVCSRKAEAVEKLQTILEPLGEELFGDTFEPNEKSCSEKQDQEKIQ